MTADSAETSSSAAITASQRRALKILNAGDCSIEGHATQGHASSGGGIINTETARTLEDAGLAESYEVGRICPWWMLRITDAGRAAL